MKILLYGINFSAISDAARGLGPLVGHRLPDRLEPVFEAASLAVDGCSGVFACQWRLANRTSGDPQRCRLDRRCTVYDRLVGHPGK